MHPMAACHCARLLACALLPALVGPVVGEVVLAMGGGGGAGRGGGAGEPVFAPRQQTVVRGARGGNVTLQCEVLHQGDKAVSWVRSRDLQILSHGGAVFTADARVSIPSSVPSSHSPSRTPSHTHSLSIARLRDSDAGRYECQLNTEPKMSLFFDLIVLDEAEAAAVLATSTEAATWEEGTVAVWAERPEVTSPQGSTVELVCGARLLQPAPRPAPPPDIRWLRDNKPLVLQEGCAVSRLSEPTYAESRLHIARVQRGDAGQYLCAVGEVSASLRLTVRTADNVGEMEPMQRDESVGGGAAGKIMSGACLLISLLAYFTTL